MSQTRFEVNGATIERIVGNSHSPLWYLVANRNDYIGIGYWSLRNRKFVRSVASEYGYAVPTVAEDIFKFIEVYEIINQS